MDLNTIRKLDAKDMADYLSWLSFEVGDLVTIPQIADAVERSSLSSYDAVEKLEQSIGVRRTIETYQKFLDQAA